MHVYILLYYIYYIHTHIWGLTKESKGILKYYEVKIINLFSYIYIYIYICHMYLLYLTNYEKYIKALSDQ